MYTNVIRKPHTKHIGSAHTKNVKKKHTNLNDGYLCGGIEPRDHERNPGMLTARNTRNNTI